MAWEPLTTFQKARNQVQSVITVLRFFFFPIPLTFLALPIDCNTYILVATTVLGQRDLYRPVAPGPVAQERAIYDYTDYEDYSPQVVPAAAEIATSGERGRLPPKQSGPSINSYYQTDCKARERTLPHEKYCDHFYQLNGCSGSDDQAILRACPNGLTYTGNGRSGLIGVCDYPHRAECVGSERHSK